MAIARHVYLMDRRTASRHPTFASESGAPEQGTRSDAERCVNGSEVRDALQRVTPERRDALLLHHVGGWSFRDIGRRLGIRETAAKLRSSRGMQQLRDMLGDRRRSSDQRGTLKSENRNDE
jgi:DNA-directed RNA polymerase specialized sigma24 family protein